MQGMSFGPADLAASRRMKTTRVGGGHPGYRVIEDPDPDEPGRAARRAPSRTRGTTRSRAWSTPARRPASCPSTAPTATSRTSLGCETQFRAAFLLGCVGAWSLHPVQIDIAKKVFSPDPDEVAFAKKVIEAIPDGAGVHMIDGKMQDDATWKQCRVMVDLAELLAAKDPELAEAYGMAGRPHAVLRVRGPRDRQARGDPGHRLRLHDRRRTRRARSPSRIGEPVVIKSQVLTGGRMKAGGVQFADTPDEAAEQAEDVLELEINGHMPRGVLVDPKADVEQEYYAGVVWDGIRKQPVMLFSDMGGIDIEEVAESHPDHVGRGHFSNILPFSDYQAKEVIASVGVTGAGSTGSSRSSPRSRSCSSSTT